MKISRDKEGVFVKMSTADMDINTLSSSERVESKSHNKMFPSELLLLFLFVIIRKTCAAYSIVIKFMKSITSGTLYSSKQWVKGSEYPNRVEVHADKSLSVLFLHRTAAELNIYHLHIKPHS